ncbi:hypothetical protein ACIA8H_09290 [Streptomyces goshikiensis]|uniref:hypothetical protein n=1 Tax=Streptomyces goshikiensis TaxID=1942 RepID=UPI0037899E99
MGHASGGDRQRAGHPPQAETAQLLGGWFSQDIVDEFPDHEAAVADYALATAELGMEVHPPEPFSYGAWFQTVATVLSAD